MPKSTKNTASMVNSVFLLRIQRAIMKNTGIRHSHTLINSGNPTDMLFVKTADGNNNNNITINDLLYFLTYDGTYKSCLCLQI